MKRITLLALIMLTIVFSVACKQEEKIRNITEEIIDKVAEDDKYNNSKKDLIIEDVFKENEIEDENQISAAKSRIKISK